MPRTALFVACLLAAAGCADAPPRVAPPSDGAKRVRDGLDALADGSGDWSKFTVTYDDRHEHHGGLKLTIRGSGTVSQEASREEVGDPRTLGVADLKVLVNELRRYQVWEQHVPDREATPDEGQARLTVAYGADTVTIWEWYNERERLSEVRRLMTGVAWKPRSP